MDKKSADVKRKEIFKIQSEMLRQDSSRQYWLGPLGPSGRRRPDFRQDDKGGSHSGVKGRTLIIKTRYRQEKRTTRLR